MFSDVSVLLFTVERGQVRGLCRTMVSQRNVYQRRGSFTEIKAKSISQQTYAVDYDLNTWCP